MRELRSLSFLKYGFQNMSPVTLSLIKEFSTSSRFIGVVTNSSTLALLSLLSQTHQAPWKVARARIATVTWFLLRTLDLSNWNICFFPLNLS